MGISLLDRQFNEFIKRLENLKQNAIKCIALNNVCLKKMQAVEIIPILEEEYLLRDSYNNALGYTQMSLEMFKGQVDLIKKYDKYSLIIREESFLQDYNYIKQHTERFYNLTQDILDDGFLVDLQLEDIENYHCLINQITCSFVQGVDIAIKKIQKSLDNTTERQK